MSGLLVLPHLPPSLCLAFFPCPCLTAGRRFQALQAGWVLDPVLCPSVPAVFFSGQAESCTPLPSSEPRATGCGRPEEGFSGPAPPPSLHAVPQPLPRAHIWPKCSVFWAVNCLPLPLGILSGFSFTALLLLVGGRCPGKSQLVPSLPLSEAVERNPWQCCSRSFRPSVGELWFLAGG